MTANITQQSSTVLPYQVLFVMGENFVFDTTSGQYYHIDEPTSVFLKLCLSVPPEIAQQKMQESKVYTNDIIHEVVSDVAELMLKGLFNRPNYAITDRDFETLLHQRYTSSWNKLELALSESCNLACKYCYCSTCRDMPNQGLMSLDTAQKALKWLFKASGKSESASITLFGGEPLLNKPVFRYVMDYSQALGKLYGKKVHYSMTTNGTLLDDEVITDIKRHNFGLMVSLDGPPEIHDKQCPTQTGENSFELAAKGIKKLMARRRAVTVRCTMTHPAPNMRKLIDFFEAFGFTRIVLGRTVNPVNPSAVDFTEEDFAEIERQEKEEIIPWILEKLSKGETPKYFPYAKFIAEQEQCNETGENKFAHTFRCGACRGTTTVGADGGLYPCHRFVGMQAWRFGHIDEGPDIENCKNFWRKYREATAKFCENCWMWTECHGPCPWEIAKADGTFKLDHSKCEKLKDYLGMGAYVLFKKGELQIVHKDCEAENQQEKGKHL